MICLVEVLRPPGASTGVVRRPEAQEKKKDKRWWLMLSGQWGQKLTAAHPASQQTIAFAREPQASQAARQRVAGALQSRAGDIFFILATASFRIRGSRFCGKLGGFMRDHLAGKQDLQIRNRR